MNHEAYIALGSNVEPRVRTMLAALHLIEKSGEVDIEDLSAVYQSEAHTGGGPAQPDYLNAVVRVHTALGPAGLLEHCLRIETALGRTRQKDGRWQARRIDLDVLLHSGGRTSGRGIEVPHPRMAERLFVLLPLADVVPPDEFLADLGSSLTDLIAACPDDARIRRTVVSLRNYK